MLEQLKCSLPDSQRGAEAEQKPQFQTQPEEKVAGAENTSQSHGFKLSASIHSRSGRAGPTQWGGAGPGRQNATTSSCRCDVLSTD